MLVSRQSINKHRPSPSSAIELVCRRYVLDYERMLKGLLGLKRIWMFEDFDENYLKLIHARHPTFHGNSHAVRSLHPALSRDFT